MKTPGRTLSLAAVALLIANQAPEYDEEDKLVRFVSRPTTSEYGLPAVHISRALADRILAAGGLESLDALQKNVDGGEFSSADVAGVRIAGDPFTLLFGEPGGVLGGLRGHDLHQARLTRSTALASELDVFSQSRFVDGDRERCQG